MPKTNDLNGEALPPEVLRKALLLACQRIAENSQVYEEVNTADGWYELFIKHAETEPKAPAAEI